VHVYRTYPLRAVVVDARGDGRRVRRRRERHGHRVQEVVSDRSNGLLFDFFDTVSLARIVEHVLTNPVAFEAMRATRVRRSSIATISAGSACPGRSAK
jgi:hypothetical protein